MFALNGLVTETVAHLRRQEQGESISFVSAHMTTSDKGQPPEGPPPGSIQIDPEEGFGPHIADRFLERYGEDSVFVTATVDCLTHRFVEVLIKAGKLPQDYASVQYGTPEMRESLECLLTSLTEKGMEKPAVVLMRSAVGHEESQKFIAAAISILGDALVATWLHRLEQEDFEGANSVLAIH